MTITYFLPDEKKAGGRYVLCRCGKENDEYKRELVFNDHTVIPMHQIVNIEADWLKGVQMKTLLVIDMQNDFIMERWEQKRRRQLCHL
ncbi:MAG: hypothetical protein ACLSD6_09845 [Clostridium sp.]